MAPKGSISSPALAPAAGFDLDGSWLRDQGFYLLIRKMVQLGIMPEVVIICAQEAYTKWKNREGSFTEFIDKQVAAYQDNKRMLGIRASDVEIAAREVVKESGKLVHAFTESLSLAAQAADRTRFILSGSPIELVNNFALDKRINLRLGTEHPQKDGFYTGGAPRTCVNDKWRALKTLARGYRLDLDDTVYIGDSLGDVSVLEIVSHPICINPECRLTQLAAERGWPVVVEKKDMLHMYRERFGKMKRLRLHEFLPGDLVEPMREYLPRFFPHLQI
jgi:phosphoserine phosphatase